MKTWMILLGVALAVAGCKPDENDDGGGDSTDNGNPSSQVDCPDPDAANVSYISEDTDTCAVVKFFCEVGEAFSDECGCGCILPEGTSPVACGGWLGDTCADDEYCKFAPEAICGWADAPGTCATLPEACTLQYDPVCGCDGNTYGNACVASASGVSVKDFGACEPDGPTACGGWLGDTCADDEFCSFTPQAICGFADASGTCAPTPEACTLQYAPVCGCNGVTYSNGCIANSHGVSVQYDGACQTQTQTFSQ